MGSMVNRYLFVLGGRDAGALRLQSGRNAHHPPLTLYAAAAGGAL